jgi:hypothetical protein
MKRLSGRCSLRPESFLIGRGRNFGCALLFFMGVEMGGGEALPPDLPGDAKTGRKEEGPGL